VRELRQRASEWLRLVEAGESFEITDRGRPVAWLVPTPPDDPLARLDALGVVLWGTGNLLDKEPLRPLPGKPLPSDVLAELRADEH
jgi:prevent-host-death family protein